MFFDEQDWRLVLACWRVIAHPKQATATADVAQLVPDLSGTGTDHDNSDPQSPLF
jgi:hypothetical protein